MPRPEDKVRRYLDANAGSVEVSVRQALSSWQLERPTQQDRARVDRDLAAVGVECEPPLVEGELSSRVTLRVREESALPRGAETSAGSAAAGSARAAPSTGPSRVQRARDLGGRAAALRPPGGHRALVGALVAGGVGSLIALGPDRIYGYGLALGVLAFALLFAARGGEPGSASADDAWTARLRWGARGLAGLALLLGLLGAVTIETRDGSEAGTELADARERDAFCNTSEGDELARLSLQGTRSAEALRETTDAVLDIADEAPPGADCAVLALDAVADTWNVFGDFPEYDNAEEQVERIRELQEDRGLRELREPAS
jgi:hypothetical protein